MGISSVCTMCEKPFDKHDEDCPVGMAEKAELAGLPEYSSSLPSWSMHEGNVLGVRKWKRNTDDGWLIGEIDVDGEDITIHWSRVPRVNPERFRLWRCKFTPTAYTDQFGHAHDGYIVNDEIDVTVVERRPAIGIWSRKKTPGMAIRAVDKNGKEYFCNWTGMFSDDSMTPMSLWRNGWVMATDLFPHVYPDGRQASKAPDTVGLRPPNAVGKPTVSYWMGRPVEELTKEELVAAMNLLGNLLEHMGRQVSRDRKVLGS